MFPVSTSFTEVFPEQTPQWSTFGARLRWLRQQHRLTLAGFGGRIGVGRSYISKLENGKNRRPSEQFMYSLCREFHVNRDWLLSGKGEPFEWDYLNKIIEGGGEISAPPPVVDEERKIFFAALIPAGLAIQFCSTVEDLAGILGKAETRAAFPEPVRVEISRILMDELSSRIALQSKDKSKTILFREPASDIGKFAVLAVRNQKEISNRERAKVEIPPSGNVENEGLTNYPHEGNISGVKPIMPKLIERLRMATKERGSKTALATWLGVSPQKVTDWISERVEPSGETTLRLLKWVEQQERQK